MVKIMGVVLGSLVVLAVVAGIAARSLSGEDVDANDPVMRNELIKRIEPIAAVRTSADDLPAVADAAMAVAEGPQTGEELVNGACAACHISGAGGAPLIGDEQAWAERREAGLDALVASVINGKGSMPARGGSQYSDEEIRRAVQHIALFEETDSADVSDVTAASDDSSAAAGTSDQTESDAGADTDAAAETDATAEDSAAASVEEAVSDDSASSALVVGQVPDGLNDNIKTAVDGVCAGCHLAGVAGAPKNGDKEAWQLRADKGLDALTASVINGLNVMPARGGSTLTDEEIPIAIQYLMSK